MVVFVKLVYEGIQFDTNEHRVMQQFCAFVFHTIVHWHKLGEVENEYT